MASKTDHTADAVDWDDLDEAPEPEGSDWINPENGEVVSGEITELSLDNGDYGVVEINGRPYSLSYSEREQLVSMLVEGSLMAVKAADEQDEFTPDDADEPIQYWPKSLRFKRGDAE